jgi:hypothetical protein
MFKHLNREQVKGIVIILLGNKPDPIYMRIICNFSDKEIYFLEKLYKNIIVLANDTVELKKIFTELFKKIPKLRKEILKTTASKQNTICKAAQEVAEEIHVTTIPHVVSPTHVSTPTPAISDKLDDISAPTSTISDRLGSLKKRLADVRTLPPSVSAPTPLSAASKSDSILSNLLSNVGLFRDKIDPEQQAKYDAMQAKLDSKYPKKVEKRSEESQLDNAFSDKFGALIKEQVKNQQKRGYDKQDRTNVDMEYLKEPPVESLDTRIEGKDSKYKDVCRKQVPILCGMNTDQRGYCRNTMADCTLHDFRKSLSGYNYEDADYIENKRYAYRPYKFDPYKVEPQQIMKQELDQEQKTAVEELRKNWVSQDTQLETLEKKVVDKQLKINALKTKLPTITDEDAKVPIQERIDRLSKERNALDRFIVKIKERQVEEKKSDNIFDSSKISAEEKIAMKLKQEEQRKLAEQAKIDLYSTAMIDYKNKDNINTQTTLDPTYKNSCRGNVPILCGEGPQQGYCRKTEEDCKASHMALKIKGYNDADTIVGNSQMYKPYNSTQYNKIQQELDRKQAEESKRRAGL